jgi:hypothetical protein
MDSRTQLKFSAIAFALLAVTALVTVGCSNSTAPASSTGSSSSITTGPAFVVGTDAPMASVTSFAVQIESINAIDSDGNSVPLISGSPNVDFARYNGLQTLLDMNDVKADTYNSVQITLGAATISYLNIQAGSAPTIVTEAATYPGSASTYTYTAILAKPLVVATTGPVGLRVDFDLRKSIDVDANGDITGSVNPTFDVKAVGTSDAGGYIDTFVAAVVSVPAAGAQSFVVQGPHGQQFTINVNGQTEWENGESISDLTASSIVEVSGTLDKADSTLDADDVSILSQNGFYAAGQITYVTPTSGAASSFDLYVRALLPANTGIKLGDIATVDLNGKENYFISRMHDQFLSKFLFNSSQLLPGQDVAVGGPATGAANEDAVTVKRVVLRHWGFNGTVLANTANQPAGTFQMQVNGFAGLLIPQEVTVYGLTNTDWRNGWSGLSDVTVGANVRVVGLLLEDPLSGQTVLLAHYVDELD